MIFHEYITDIVVAMTMLHIIHDTYYTVLASEDQKNQKRFSRRLVVVGIEAKMRLSGADRSDELLWYRNLGSSAIFVLTCGVHGNPFASVSLTG
jgi:hypothetical protein